MAITRREIRDVENSLLNSPRLSSLLENVAQRTAAASYTPPVALVLARNNEVFEHRGTTTPGTLVEFPVSEHQISGENGIRIRVYFEIRNDTGSTRTIELDFLKGSASFTLFGTSPYLFTVPTGGSWVSHRVDIELVASTETGIELEVFGSVDATTVHGLSTSPLVGTENFRIRVEHSTNHPDLRTRRGRYIIQEV